MLEFIIVLLVSIIAWCGKYLWNITPTPKQITGGSEKSHTEIEVAFGTYTDHYQSGLTSLQFNNIKNALMNMKIPHTITKDVTERHNDIRRITMGNSIKYEKKIKLQDQIDKEWEYRIVASSEIPISKSHVPDFKPTRTKRRHRYSFVPPKGHEFHGLRFDLTIAHIGRINYEVEIELLGQFNKSDITRIFKMMPPNLKNAIEFILQTRSTTKMNRSERLYVIDSHNKLVSSLEGARRNSDPFALTSGYENKSENISVTDLVQSKGRYAITLKLDGVRRMLLIIPKGIYMLEKDTILKIGDSNIKMGHESLYDGEFYEGEFYTFDVLFHEGRQVTTNYNLFERLKLIEYLQIDNLVIKPKHFHTQSDMYDRIKSAVDEMNSSDLRTDGLIFQSLGGYKNKYTRKWKPPEQMTIDFKLDDKLRYMSYDKDGLVEFQGTPEIPFDKKFIIPKESKLDEGYEDRIIEFKWNDKSKNFDAERYRDDRPLPNHIYVAKKVWKDIHFPVPLNTILGLDLRTIRRYNQMQKRQLMEKYLTRGDNIIDFGSGQGADIKTWKSLKLENIYVIEPDKNILKEFNRRLGNNERVHVLNTGAENTGRIKKEIGKNPITSINTFYSLTFFGKDKKIYNAMLKTLQLLSRGGMILGSVMDGEKTQELLTRHSGSFSCPAFSITKTKTTNSQFGNEIMININDDNTMINNLKEWLFYFEPFRKDLEKLGFELTEDYFYSDDAFSKLPNDAQTFGSLYRVFAFTKK